MPRKQNPDPISAQQQQDLVSEGIENFELPKSVVVKIAKSALPEEARLTKETVLALVKGSTVFINYLAATAHNVAVGKQHKSIAASDVLKALDDIQFGDLVDSLQAELQVYKDQSKTGGGSRKSTAGTNGSGPTSSKGLSISIPAAASASARAQQPLTLKVKSASSVSANGAAAAAADKGKAKESTVDEDGDEDMEPRDDEEEEEVAQVYESDEDVDEDERMEKLGDKPGGLSDGEEHGDEDDDG